MKLKIERWKWQRNEKQFNLLSFGVLLILLINKLQWWDRGKVKRGKDETTMRTNIVDEMKTQGKNHFIMFAFHVLRSHYYRILSVRVLSLFAQLRHSHLKWHFVAFFFFSSSFFLILPFVSSDSIGCFNAVISRNVNNSSTTKSLSFRTGATWSISHSGVSDCFFFFYIRK